MNKNNQVILRKVVERLILEADTLQDQGLYNGKLGIAIFFAHYACYMQNSIYTEYACSLINRLSSFLCEGYSYSMKNGLAGVGWGIEYLIQNNLIDADSDDVLEELDNSLMFWNIDRIKNHTIEQGYLGIFRYIFVRLNTLKRKNRDKRPFDELYLDSIVSKINRVLPITSDLREKDFLLKLNSLILYDTFDNQKPVLSEVLDIKKMEFANVECEKLGLEDGLSGVGIKLMGL